MNNPSKKILIYLLIFFVGILVGNVNCKSEDNIKVEEMNCLNRGTYNSFYPDNHGYITLTIDGDYYEIYEKSEFVDKGKYSYENNNSFKFEGEKFNFQMNYVNDIYVCSFKNKKNYPHFELKYDATAVVKYPATTKDKE